jgi:hypothetical protein
MDWNAAIGAALKVGMVLAISCGIGAWVWAYLWVTFRYRTTTVLAHAIGFTMLSAPLLIALWTLFYLMAAR